MCVGTQCPSFKPNRRYDKDIPKYGNNAPDKSFSRGNSWGRQKNSELKTISMGNYHGRVTMGWSILIDIFELFLK